MTEHGTTNIPRRKRSIAPTVLIAGAAVFLLAIGTLVVSSIVQEALPTFEPRASHSSVAARDTLVLDTVTVNASGVDEWRFFDFERGMILDLPDTTGWDLAFQRFKIIAAGGVLDLGPGPFDAVLRAPEGVYVATEFGRDTVNAALERWYSYSWMTHRLKPKSAVYAVQTRDGRFAKLEFLSYYCTGMAPGCVTFRYAYQGKPAREFR